MRDREEREMEGEEERERWGREGMWRLELREGRDSWKKRVGTVCNQGHV